ncbi:MAG: hypothetical protein AAFO07_28035, partial [Bacteroidota bacterium]
MKANFTKAIFTTLLSLSLFFQADAQGTSGNFPDPVIDMAAATFYVAPCEETASFIYSVLVTDTDDDVTDRFNLLPSGSLAAFEDASAFKVEPRGDFANYNEFTFVDVPPGVYTFTYFHFDVDGPEVVQLQSGPTNAFKASATITVVAAPAVDLDELSCNDDVNVTLGNDCTADVTADMVLEGQNICKDDFTVIVDYGMGMKTKDEITECGKFKYEVYTGTDESTTDFVCWGYITGEDKDAPKYDKTIYDATITCTDVDSILKYSASDLQLKKGKDVNGADSCFFAGKSWDILEDQDKFYVNDIYDNCSEFCHLSFEINDLLMEGDVCEGSMIVRTIRVTDEKGNTS